jgi:ribosomal protein S27AE
MSADPYQWCVKCGQSYVTAADLLAAHNKNVATRGLAPETDVERVRSCPECGHYLADGEDPYQWCFECGQDYPTPTDLLAAHNRVLASLHLTPETDVGQVRCCPECTHDFLYPPVEVTP